MIDRPATLWDEMFLPENLERAVMAYYGLDCTLVVDNEGHYPEIPDTPQNNILFSVLMGLILGGISSLLLVWRKDRAVFIYSGVVYVLFGLLGTLLLFMMFFTNHDVTWFNENLLFVNPLLIVLAVFCFIRSPKTRLLCRIELSIIVILCFLKLILPAVFMQFNWPVIIVMTMVSLPGCFLRKRR